MNNELKPMQVITKLHGHEITFTQLAVGQVFMVNGRNHIKVNELSDSGIANAIIIGTDIKTLVSNDTNVIPATTVTVEY